MDGRWLFTTCIALMLAVAPGASAQTLDKKTLSLDAALKVAAAAAAEARVRNVGVVIAVVDDGGHLIVLHRLDDTQVTSVNVGIGKALHGGDLPPSEQGLRGSDPCWPCRRARSGRQHSVTRRHPDQARRQGHWRHRRERRHSASR